MARKLPPEHGRIKPGEVRNPLGAGAHTRVKLSASFRKLSAKQVERIGSAVMTGDPQVIKKMKDDPKESVLARWIAKIAYDGMISGDLGTMEVLLNRFVGKVTDKIKHTGIPPSQQAVVFLPEKELHDKAAEGTANQVPIVSG